MTWFLVFIGGGLGSLARYAIYLQFSSTNYAFYAGTWIANLLACMLLGFIIQWDSVYVQPSLRLLIATGFCGGFSTFSTFSLEALTLLQSGQWKEALFYVIGSIVSGLLGLLLGVWLS